ncbi:hypothetical protein [Nostocoides australiense]|nr:hypothetical protein [Tetrasphaera australiensis]HRW03257.1 hypothetical protein [Tetrasphaera sp.]
MTISAKWHCIRKGDTMHARWATPVAIVAVALGGTTAALASTPAAKGCTWFADAPNSNNDAAVGRKGCTNTIKANGYIKENRVGPDDIVGETLNVGAGWFMVYGTCGNGQGKYFAQVTAVNSSGGARSDDVVRCN